MGITNKLEIVFHLAWISLFRNDVLISWKKRKEKKRIVKVSVSISELLAKKIFYYQSVFRHHSPSVRKSNTLESYCLPFSAF